jgi:hypothetical protein
VTGNIRQLDPDHDLYDWAAVELRRQRKVRGVTAQAVADIIGKDRSLISKIEAVNPDCKRRMRTRLTEPGTLAICLGGLSDLRSPATPPSGEPHAPRSKPPRARYGAGHSDG